MDYLYFTKQDMKYEQALLKTYKAILKLLPEGKLRRKKSREKFRYYYDVGNTVTYINEEKSGLILKLQLKKILEIAVEKITENLSLQEAILKNYTPYDLMRINANMKGSYSGADLRELDAFMAQFTPAEGVMKNCVPGQSMNYIQNFRLVTSFGLKVKSKSEALIAELLYKEGIPFQYERKITLKDNEGIEHEYFPDFTIFTKSGEKILWEHSGMMDRRAYLERLVERLAVYCYNGYIPPGKLIISMDGPGGTLDLHAIQHEIESLKSVCL